MFFEGDYVERPVLFTFVLANGRINLLKETLYRLTMACPCRSWLGERLFWLYSKDVENLACKTAVFKDLVV